MAARTIDIAKIAGVSPASVSLVLNGKPGVGEATRQKILRIAGELGYELEKVPFRSGYGEKQPSTTARDICFLRIARHGHTVNRDHDVFIADYIEGLGVAARDHNLSLDVQTFKTTPIDEVVDAAAKLNASGFVVLGTELSSPDIEEFSRLSKPVVFIDTYNDFLDFDFVDMNNEDSVYRIVSHFHERGHRDIGIVTGAIETRNFKLREEGFAASLAALGLKRDVRFDFIVDQTYQGARNDMAKALAQGHPLPSALFCANDVIACGCLKALTAAGMKVPEDISLAGFDDLPLSAVVDPPLTTIQVSKAKIGQTAVELLAARILKDSDTPPMKVLIGGKLILRRSVQDIRMTSIKGGSP